MLRLATRVLFVATFLFGFSAHVFGDPLLTYTIKKHIYVLSVVEDGEPVDITPQGMDVAVPVWSPDSSCMRSM